jgi:hypothetical protein
MSSRRQPRNAALAAQGISQLLPAGVLAKNSIHRNNVTQLLQQTGYTCLQDSVSLRQIGQEMTSR